MKYSEIIENLRNKNIRYPRKKLLTPLPVDPLSGKMRGYINAEVKAPIAFCPKFGNRTQIFLVDESGSPDLTDKSNIFQLGILQGELEEISNTNIEILSLRSAWPDRNGSGTKFHHSKDTSVRKIKFEEYCLKKKYISFLHYKIDKSRKDYDIFSNEHKATIYFSALISALHDSQYSHGKVQIIASDRPNTFSDDLIYELRRVAKIQALASMEKYPIVGCCLPEIELIRKKAEEYPSLDICDYLIFIMGSGDHSFQYKYDGCSLFEASDNFDDWSIHETYYSNSYVFPEGRLLRFLKRKISAFPQTRSITSRILTLRSMPDIIFRSAHEIVRSRDKDEFIGSIIFLSSRIGPYLDTKYANIPLNENEYTLIKSVGAYFRLLLDYGFATSNGDPFIGKEQFLQLHWR